jgi:hypothetical protein
MEVAVCADTRRWAKSTTLGCGRAVVCLVSVKLFGLGFMMKKTGFIVAALLAALGFAAQRRRQTQSHST